MGRGEDERRGEERLEERRRKRGEERVLLTVKDKLG